MSKLKIATYWLGGCSGCHMSLLDIDERILEVAKLADIVKSPIVDGKGTPMVDVALVEGSLSTEEHLEQIHEIRQNSKILVALGDCAVTGNVTRLRNPFPQADVLNRAYKECETNVGGCMPSQVISPLLPKAMPLSAAVKVDVNVPGCPPHADVIFHAVAELLNGRIPNLENVKYG